MAVVEFEEGTLSIDAAVIGRGLSVEPWLVQARMREGKITVLCERGVDVNVSTEMGRPLAWDRLGLELRRKASARGDTGWERSAGTLIRRPPGRTT